MAKPKIIIAGGRKFVDYETLSTFCDKIIKGRDVEIVSGGAFGADKLGEEYAKDKGYTIKEFPADWNTHGKSAGPIRNKQMAEYADALIVFWDGESLGTKHMIDIVESKGLPVKVCMYLNHINYFSHEESHR